MAHPVALLPAQASAGIGFGESLPQQFAGPAMPMQAAAGMGAGPDGLGQVRQLPMQSTLPQYEIEREQLGYELPVEPKDTSSAAAVRSAGFTALLSAVSIGVGVAMAGPVGGAAGLMLAGALANGYRAQKWMNEQDPGRRHEAVVSATFAVGELALGSYLAYKAYKTKKTA